jgi:hypothetical protein
MNLGISMLSVTIRLQNSGSILSGCKKVGDLTEWKLVKYITLSKKIIQNYWRHGVNISVVEIEFPRAEKVEVTEDTLSVDLSDGRTISVPLEWFPRLLHATLSERNNWRLIGRGHGIHWEDLDEDISVEGLLKGRPSGESQKSFKKWLSQRKLRLTTPSSGRQKRRR